MDLRKEVIIKEICSYPRVSQQTPPTFLNKGDIVATAL